jgi:RNA polymerase sigma factor (TIGR02999 family)
MERSSISGGTANPSVTDWNRLYMRAYDELRGLASKFMSQERLDHTLQPTALVNEAYLKLRAEGGLTGKEDKGFFMACAARAMKQVLVDCARRHRAQKRPQGRVDVTLESLREIKTVSLHDFLAIHEALNTLAGQTPNGNRHARLIEYVWFGGISITNAAERLGISRRQAHRDWAWARTWLEKELSSA